MGQHLIPLDLLHNSYSRMPMQASENQTFGFGDRGGVCGECYLRWTELGDADVEAARALGGGFMMNSSAPPFRHLHRASSKGSDWLG